MSSNQFKILIADDNPQGAELLEAYLAETDFLVKTAGDGEQTLKMVSEWNPDLILLDIMMPRMSGFEVCKRLRSNAQTNPKVGDCHAFRPTEAASMARNDSGSHSPP